MKVKIPILFIRGGIYDAALLAADKHLSGKSGNLLYVVLDSWGGDPSAGYRIMRMLQAKYTEIIAIVPGEAYSTATLMALGSDKIYMRKSACLGPLDIQIKHPSDGSMISSLEIRDTLNTLAGFLQTYAESFSDTLKTDFMMGKKDAAELAMKTATEMINPIIGKIDPINLQSSSRSSKIGQKYAENLLKSRMMKSTPALARAVSIHLANNYDYHGYAIMLEEASGILALDAHDVSTLEAWGVIQPLYEASSKSKVTYQTFDVALKKEIVQNATSANAKIKSKSKGKK